MSGVRIQHSTKINYNGELVPLGNCPTIGHSEPSKNSNVATWVVGTAILTASATYSSPANASIDSILNGLVTKAQEMLQPLLDSTFGAFSQLINSGTSDASAAVMQSSAQGSDAIVNAMKSVADNQIGLESMPPPSYCESDEIGAASRTLGVSSQMTLDSLVTQSVQIHNSTSNAIYSTKINTIAQRYSGSSANPNRHIQLASILNNSNITNQDDVKAYIDGVDAMSIGATQKINLKPSMATSESGAERAVYVANSGKAAKLELAKGILYESLTERMSSSSGESKLSLMDKEVSRTYGGEGAWRSELLEYAAPTPLLVELNKQLAFANYLSLEQLKKISKQNILIASQITDIK